MEAPKVGLELGEGLLRLGVGDQIFELIGIGFQIVELVGVGQFQVVDVFPTVGADGLVAHVGHTREDVVGEVLDQEARSQLEGLVARN